MTPDEEVLKSFVLAADQKCNSLVQEKQNLYSTLQELNKKIEKIEVDLIATESRRNAYVDLILDKYNERKEQVDDNG